MHLHKSVRVAIRGIAGLLGSRLARVIQQHPLLKLTCGIAKHDATLARLLVLQEGGYELLHGVPIYLAEKHKAVEALRQRYPRIDFRPLDQLSLRACADLVIDATMTGMPAELAEQYAAFPGIILMQSGAYPAGRLIAPPFLAAGEETRVFRQGDCLLSGLVPLLAPFTRLGLKKVRVNMLMQYGDKLGDYPVNQRIAATYIRTDVQQQLEQELTLLLPDTDVRIDSVLQVPGLDYYTATIVMELEEEVSLSRHGRMNAGEVLEHMRKSPRVFVASEAISSTYMIDHFLREPLVDVGEVLPPIVLYGGSVRTTACGGGMEVRLQASFFSRLIAVLPNLDAAVILTQKCDALAAMRGTDEYAGLLMKSRGTEGSLQT